MGGFSYVQPQYLVQVLQNLIQAAPAVAFEIALDTFAPQIKNIVNDITALINQINKLNLNSCQAINGIKTYVENNILKNREATAAKGAAEAQASGSSEGFFSSIQKWYEDFSKQFEKLKQDLQSHPLRSKNGLTVSFSSNSLVEDALKNTQIGSDNQIAALIRGILGDINPSNLIALCQGNGAGTGYIPPVTTNLSEDFLEKWLNGQVNLIGMDANGNPVPISYNSIKEKVMNDIQSLYQDMVEGKKPNPDRYLYLTYSEIPVIAYLKLLASTNDPDLAAVINDKMADIITLSVVYGTIRAVLKSEIKELQSLVTSYKEQYSQADCVSDAVSKDFAQILRNYQTFTERLTNVYYEMLNQRRQELLQFFNNYKRLQQILYKRVSEVLPEGGL
jgi:conjugative transfer pilus assembly protein TraH